VEGAAGQHRDFSSAGQKKNLEDHVNDLLRVLLFFFLTLVTGPRSSLRLKMSDTRFYEPHTRARLQAAEGVAQDIRFFCKATFV